MKRKVICVFLSIVFILSTPVYGNIQSSAASINEIAVDQLESPLTVNIESDSDKYSTYSVATITITIQNTSAKRIDNILTYSSFAQIQPVGSGSKLSFNGSLEPDEQISYSFQATIRPERIGLFRGLLLRILNYFRGVAPNNVSPKTDNHYLEATASFKFGTYEAKEFVKTWYNYDTDVIETNSTNSFETAASSLVEGQIIDDDTDDPYRSNRIIVEGSSLGQVDLQSFDPDTVIYNQDKTKMIIQFSSSSSCKACASSLGAMNNIDYAEPDVIVRTAEFGGSTTISAGSSSSEYTWGKSFIHADEYAYYLEKNSYFNLITVAVVDSGVEMNHPFFKGRLTSSGYDYVQSDPTPQDENGHGTHVSGIIVDCTPNLNVKIMPIRALNAEGSGSSINVAHAIDHAVNNGANVINLSLGSETRSRYIEDAIYRAIKKGIIVCIAAGNGDKNGNPVDTDGVYPANISEAIVVAALDQNNKIATFSNYGKTVDVAAPGVNITSTYLNSGYARMSGTSMATPHISAAAALFKLALPSNSPAEIESRIKQYCIDLGTTGRDDIYGDGKLNLYNAIPNCTIHFNTNGGSSTSDKTTKSSKNIQLPNPSKSYSIRLNANGGSLGTSQYTRNCTLEGWYKSSSLSGIRYAPGDSYMALQNETLYAKWINPTVGSLNSPTRTNYDFIGWYSAASGGVRYTSSTQISGNITLYAHWEIVKKTIGNYIGWDKNSAENALRALGMNVVWKSENSDYYGSGKIIAQSIPANSSVAVGSTITLTYSAGPAELQVGEWVVFGGGTLYRTVAGGPRNGVYKPDASEGTITDVYYWNGTKYYQFQYAGANTPFGWGEASLFYRA